MVARTTEEKPAIRWRIALCCAKLLALGAQRIALLVQDVPSLLEFLAPAQQLVAVDEVPLIEIGKASPLGSHGIDPAPELGQLRLHEFVGAGLATGRQGQVDFGTFRFPWGRRHALVVVLGYSRLLWLRFYAVRERRNQGEHPHRYGCSPVPGRRVRRH